MVFSSSIPLPRIRLDPTELWPESLFEGFPHQNEDTASGSSVTDSGDASDLGVVHHTQLTGNMIPSPVGIDLANGGSAQTLVLGKIDLRMTPDLSLENADIFLDELTPSSDPPGMVALDTGAGSTTEPLSSGELDEDVAQSTIQTPGRASPSTGGKYRCSYPGCEVIVKHRFNLKPHMRRHTGEQPYKCSKCGRTFAWRSSYRNHILKVHLASENQPGWRRNEDSAKNRSPS